MQARRSRAVARNHEQLDVCLDQPVKALQRVPAHICDWLWPVRHMRGITQIDRLLVWQLVENGARNR
jgi:hypothetical protein